MHLCILSRVFTEFHLQINLCQNDGVSVKNASYMVNPKMNLPIKYWRKYKVILS